MKTQSMFITIVALLVGAALGYFVPPLFSNAAEPAEEDATEEAKAPEKRTSRTRVQSSREHDADLNRLRSRIKSLERQLAEQTETAEPVGDASTNRVERGRPFGHPPSAAEMRAHFEEMREKDPERYAQITNNMARWRTHRQERLQNQFDILASADTTHMTKEQRRVHETYQDLLARQEELHELQPGLSIHVSEVTPDEFVMAGAKVIRQGHGYPSVFNPDTYTKELVRQGKTQEDANEGGCSGCIEVGAFGKEAYILTGYLNTPKILEITLNNGVDPMTGKKLGLETGDPRTFTSYEELYDAYHKQMIYFVNLKLAVNNYIERMFSLYAPATFLSLFIDDCITRGRDYYSGGARYNTTYIQCTGLGTITDCLATLKKHVFEDKKFTMDELLEAVASNWGRDNSHTSHLSPLTSETMRQFIMNRTPFFGNDDDYADDIAVKVYNDLVKAIEGHPNTRGGKTQLNMLSTTCHNYFGSVCGASVNGRLAHFAISDGTSPAHGADTNGPTAVIKSLGKLDQTQSGGTLLNVRFVPSLLKRDEDLMKLVSLIRTYFRMGGHHIQFNIVDTQTLLDAQQQPDDYKDLLVRVAGYSDYFNDMTEQLQNEIIARTENDTL